MGADGDEDWAMVSDDQSPPPTRRNSPIPEITRVLVGQTGVEGASVNRERADAYRGAVESHRRKIKYCMDCEFGPTYCSRWPLHEAGIKSKCVEMPEGDYLYSEDW